MTGTPDLPAVTFVIPAYNATATIERCLRSALRQRRVDKRIVVVDHASTDGTGDLVQHLAEEHAEIESVPLTRKATDRKSPSRPLNEGFAAALRGRSAPAERSWIFRLDADDLLAGDEVIADQLSAGGYRELVMATLVFFDERERSAYEYGPRSHRRTLHGLPGRDIYAVTHHATAIRTDLLDSLAGDLPLYDETLETGEDLGVTCRLLRALGGDESRFAFVSKPYCYKALDEATITGSLPLRRVWASHRKLLRDHPEMSRFAVARGLAELALGRVTSESFARRGLQLLAGHNGEYRAVDYDIVANRLAELAGTVSSR